MSDSYQFSSGQYPYPLNRVLTSGGDFCKPFIPGDPDAAEPGVDNFYIICCTPDQMNKITSSLEVGAPIAFPDFYNDVIQLVDQAVEFPNSFEGAACVDLCQLIIECIETTPELQALIAGFGASENRENAQNQNGVALAGYANPTCDKDILFGQVTQLVDYMDQVNQDVLEIVEVQTNQAEILGEILGNITGIDETSIDAFIAWISQMQDSIAENYLAQVTVAYKEELSCEIFCQARLQGCAVTPTLLFDVLKARLAASVSIESIISDTLNYLTSGSWAGSEIADFMYFSQIAIRAQVGRLIGNVAWTDIDMRLAIYANDPDSDWMLLCTSCADWVEVFDFTDEEFSEYVSDLNTEWVNTWQSGLGWVMNQDAGGARGGILFTMPAQANLISVEATVFRNVTATNTRSGGIKMWEDSGGWSEPAEYDFTVVNNDDGTIVYEHEGDYQGIESIGVYVGARQGAPAVGRVTQLVISGTGTNPFL